MLRSGYFKFGSHLTALGIFYLTNEAAYTSGYVGSNKSIHESNIHIQYILPCLKMDLTFPYPVGMQLSTWLCTKEKRTYREHKVVAHAQNRFEEGQPLPHHIYIGRAHEHSLMSHLGRLHACEKIAVADFSTASIIRLLIVAYNEDML